MKEPLPGSAVPPNSGPPPGSPPPGRLLLYGSGLFLLNLLVLSLHIFSHQELASVDGMYHARMAQLYLEQGIFTDFPWMQYSFARDFWVDHHFFYHLILIPLAGLDLVDAQRWAGALLGALALAGCSVYLLRHGVKRVWIFAPLLLLASDQFLFRMMMARSMSLALILMIGVLYALERRRRLWLMLLCFVFIWSYHAALIALPLALAATVIQRLKLGKWDYAPLLYAGAGLLLGLTLNPFFPDTFNFLFFHSLPLAKLATGGPSPVPSELLPQVMEWNALSPSTWVVASVPTILACVVVPALCWRGRRRWPAGLWLLGGTSVAAMCASFFVSRALEYAVPLAYLTGARILWLTPPPWSVKWRRAASAALLILLLGLGIASHIDLIDDFKVDPRPMQAAANWLIKNTPEGATVFHADYTLWSFLFMHNVHNNYIVGLSPLWLYNWDPERYLIYRAVALGRGRDPVATIRGYFDCRYVIVVPWDQGLIRRLKDSPRAARAYGDQFAEIYRLD